MASRVFSFDADFVLSIQVAAATVIERGDMLVLASGLGEPAEDFTWDTDIATTQAAMHDVFLGVAIGDHAANADEDWVSYSPICIVEFDCAAATFNIGAVVGAAKQTGDGIESQKVVSVANEGLAVGRVVEHYGSNTTKVKTLVRGLVHGGPSALA